MAMDGVSSMKDMSDPKTRLDATIQSRKRRQVGRM
jgi:hypothetical protein